ncbi:MAG: ATP-dependent DNA helicase RecG [Gemmatimonadales bacterium]|nr:MAG: ATP-dependent DNA helicase RecG [Gemmatimonadales bacterium]
MGYGHLDRPAQFLKGVGPKRADALKKLAVGTARDLLYHTPRRYDDASTIHPIDALQVGQDATIRGRVRSSGVLPTRSGLKIFQAVLQDDSGMITCAWPGQPWLDRKIREGDQLLVTGPVKFFHGRQLHPREHTLLARAGKPGDGDEGEGGRVYTAYPGTDDLPQWVLRRIYDANLDWLLAHAHEEEYLPPGWREGLGLPELPEAFRRLHRPAHIHEPEEGRRRLAFDELFFLQLVQALARHRETRLEPGIVHTRTNELIRGLHQRLPFRLTDAQARVLREVSADMTSPARMNRFVQGDVGAGKTMVAVFAMLLAVEGGHQAVLMAPTELLAEQHAGKLEGLLEPLGVEVALLTGSLKGRDRDALLARLAAGNLPVVVGTHALIQDGVDFHRLGLVVVDEQHRFGVRQRMALVERGDGGPRPDMLVMSATPIPRSLALTLYGDLDLSILDEMPPGRTPVKTLLRFPSQRDEVYQGVERELEAGRQGYLVYPLVEETERSHMRAAVQEFQRLSTEVFPHRRLALLHGQLPADEKEAVMRRFRDGEVDLLVATTVIEVGIDVPNATVMIIEHAERFGLSQLHQLRGRVGRGGGQSWCILISEPGEAAAERLKVFASTTDGFKIARADLEIRGQGDLFGAQQHGRDPFLRFADLTLDEELVSAARRLAREIVERDPELAGPEHSRIREVLEARHAERFRMWKVG